MESSKIAEEINEKLKGKTEEEKRRLLGSLLVFCRCWLLRMEKKNGRGEPEPAKGETLYHSLLPGYRTGEKGQDLRRAVYEAMRVQREEDPRRAAFLDPESVLLVQSPGEFEEIFAIFAELCSHRGPESEEKLTEIYERAMQKEAGPRRSRYTNEYYAPRQMAKCMAELLEPRGGSVYDPSCGTGGLLLAMAAQMGEERCALYGQEFGEETRKMAGINLFLHGFYADLGEKAAAALKEDLHPGLRADYIVGNPPFHAQCKREEILEEDPRWRYGIPPKNREGLLWLQHMLWHLGENGRMALLLSTGVLDSRYKSEKGIRKGLVEEDLIEAIVLLPPGIFHGTRTEMALWLLSKRKSRVCEGRILFIDASGKQEGKLEEAMQERLCGTCRAYRQGGAGEEAGFCTVVHRTQVEAQEYALDPRRYIFYERAQIREGHELDREEEMLRDRLRILGGECAELLREILGDAQDVKDW